MKQFLLMLAIAIAGLPAFAQETIRGVVVDSKNEPMPGVRVEVVERSEFVYTDIDGTYVIDIPGPAKKLRFTYIGYKPMELKIKNPMTVKFGGSGWYGHLPHYRGFYIYDNGIGHFGPINVFAGNSEVRDLGKKNLQFGAWMSHGVQINEYLYAGVGAGVEISGIYYKDVDRNYRNEWAGIELDGVNFPFFADVRWDFDITKKASPYVGLKIGAQIYRTGYDGGAEIESWTDKSHLNIRSRDCNSFFLQPSVGMRTRMKGRGSFNIGLSYSVFNKRKYEATCDYVNDGNWTNDFVDLGYQKGGILKFEFGFDW